MTFLDEYLAGTVEAEGIHDQIDVWHGGAGDETLHEHLGMTWEQYAAWVQSGMLRDRRGLPDS